jgi:hypothetical protein
MFALDGLHGAAMALPSNGFALPPSGAMANTT